MGKIFLLYFARSLDYCLHSLSSQSAYRTFITWKSKQRKSDVVCQITGSPSSVTLEIYGIVEIIRIYLRFFAFLFVLLGLRVNFAAFLHGVVMVLCQIVAVTKGHKTICNGSRSDRKNRKYYTIKGFLPYFIAPWCVLNG